jgi:hypothetical protein
MQLLHKRDFPHNPQLGLEQKERHSTVADEASDVFRWIQIDESAATEPSATMME